MTPRTHHWWVPVTLSGPAYIRVEAVSAEDAINMVEGGQFTDVYRRVLK